MHHLTQAPDLSGRNALAVMKGKIKVALGGRVAEETAFGTITTGAESDIDQVTMIARQTVGRWGMSEVIGFVKVLPADGRGHFPGTSGESSEATQRVLDEEVRQLVDVGPPGCDSRSDRAPNRSRHCRARCSKERRSMKWTPTPQHRCHHAPQTQQHPDRDQMRFR